MPAPITPSKAGAGQGTPGSWKHPKFDEVLRRQDARSFSDRRISQAVKNTAALASSFIVAHLFYRSSIYSSLPRNDATSTIYLGIYYCMYIARILFAYNIAYALIGPMLGPDPMVDIPLTADQRSSLSLPPTPQSASVAPIAAETSQYITPPRYNRASPLPANSPLSTNRPTTPTSSSRLANVSAINFSGKVRVTAAGSPIGPGQLTSPGSFRSPSPVFNTPSPYKSIGTGVEKRHSFSSPRMTPGGRAIGQGTLVNSAQPAGSPSVFASPKWLDQQKNRRRDIFG